MKDSKKMKNQDEQDLLFLEKLTALTEKLGCRGPIPGEPRLPAAGDSLTLKQIAQLKVMMGSPDMADLAFKIGAIPSDELMTLNDALKTVHGKEEHKAMKILLGKYKKADDIVNQIESTRPAKKTKPRSSKS